MKLYKYAVRDRIDVLVNGLIRFTQPIAQNDPFEMRPILKQVMSEDTFREEVIKPSDKEIRERVLDELIESLYQEAKKAGQKRPRKSFRGLALSLMEAHQSKFNSFLNEGYAVITEAFKSAEPDILNSLSDTLLNRIGMLSLTESPDHPLMWAHYAGANTGIVLAFDSENEYFTTRRSEEDEVSGLHKVTYAEERPEIKDFQELFDREDWYTVLCATKGKHWEYEQEWRMIKLLKEAAKSIPTPTGDIHLFEVPISCITEVILGDRMPLKEQDEVADLLQDPRYSHISLSKIVKDEKSFKFRITQYDD